MGKLTTDDAQKYLLDWIRNPRDIDGYGQYGYGFLLRLVGRSYLKEEDGIQRPDERSIGEVSPPFMAAAWDLCRMGIIRPGVKDLGQQATPGGNGGDGYTVTPYGKQWLAEEDRDIFIPTEDGRFAELLEPYKEIFGPGFHERAQQAIRCYRANAYLACCAMCGAAAESIILSLAIRKEGDEDKVLKQYAASGGRGRITKNLTGQVDERLRREFDGLVDPINFWRDESSHGKVSDINDNEAYIALQNLLRFAGLAKEHRTEFTGVA